MRHRVLQAELFGAASLSGVKPSPSRAAHPYQGEVLSSVAGILHECPQLGSVLLISAALHHRLDTNLPFRFQLHVAFEVPGTVTRQPYTGLPQRRILS